jgi:hypothetical protein
VFERLSKVGAAVTAALAAHQWRPGQHALEYNDTDQAMVCAYTEILQPLADFIRRSEGDKCVDASSDALTFIDAMIEQYVWFPRLAL